MKSVILIYYKCFWEMGDWAGGEGKKEKPGVFGWRQNAWQRRYQCHGWNGRDPESLSAVADTELLQPLPWTPLWLHATEIRAQTLACHSPHPLLLMFSTQVYGIQPYMKENNCY